MGKRLKRSPETDAAIINNTGNTEMDLNNLAIYEATALSTLPISPNKRFFGNGVITKSTLLEMADYLNNQGLVNLQVMHRTQDLPVGRLFQGSVKDNGNQGSQLITKFYIPLNKEDIVNDINNSLIDEVSVGLLTKTAKCSSCNFDYYAEDSSVEHFYTETCPQDHVLGQDGVHLVLDGLAGWSELSLVNQGAAKNAKISNLTKKDYDEKDLTRFKQFGITDIDKQLNLSCKLTLTKESPKMETKEFLELLENKSQKISDLEHSVKLSAEKIIALEETNKQFEKDSEIKITELASKLEASDKLILQLNVLIKEQVTSALVASGENNNQELLDKLTSVELFDLIEKSGKKLHQLVAAKSNIANQASLEYNNEQISDVFKRKGKK